MLNEKIELTAGELSSRVTTAENKNNWAQIAERLFNQIIMNRSLMLACIQSRAPFRPKQPDNLDELMGGIACHR